MNRRTLHIACMLLVSVQIRAQGQADSAATIARRDLGQRVRARSAAGSVAGVLRDVRTDSLFIEGDSGGPTTRAISATSLSRLDVYEPLTPTRRHQRGFIGLLTGALLGAAAGSALAVPTVHGIENRPDADGPFQQIDYLIFPVIGGLVGGTVGWTVGDHRSHRWVVQFSTAR